MKKVCVFTALTFEKGKPARAKIQPFPQIKHFKWECEAYLFTNNVARLGTISPTRKWNGWTVVELSPELCEKYYTRLLARYVKTHSHSLLPECDVSLWVDANMVVRPSFISVVDAFDQSKFPFQSIKHPARMSTYREIDVCYQRQMDPKPEMFRKQKQFYFNERFPDRGGLFETRLVFRKDNEIIHCLNELWWSTIRRFTVRDQCAIMYCLWKLQVPYVMVTYKSIQKIFERKPEGFGSTNTYGRNQLQTIVARPFNPYRR